MSKKDISILVTKYEQSVESGKPIYLDADEFVSVFTMKLDDAVDKVMSGEITDSKTVSAILKLKLLKERGEF